jgi:HEPN domain-containing protein
MKIITKQWLEYAKADIRSCDNNIKDDFLTNIVVFHCQQTIEKCFKAIIEENELDFKRIHSLFKLYTIIKDKINFSINIEKLELIDKVYTTSRYPSDLGLMPDGKPSIAEAKEMYEFAKQVYENTLKMFNDTTKEK